MCSILIPFPELTTRLSIYTSSSRQWFTAACARNVAQTDQLIHHGISRLLDQIVHMLRPQALCLDGRQDRDLDDARAEPLALGVQHMVIVATHDGHNRDLCLYG